jgi:galactokinase
VSEAERAVDRGRRAFADRYGSAPAVVWSAPGRVNLIGEHTDYNDGFVLPFALPHRTAVAMSTAESPHWTVWSEANDEVVQFGRSELTPGGVTGWAAYVAGVLWALDEAGLAAPPARIAVASDVPLGAGLSSSAALECAVLAAALDLSGGPDLLPRSRWPAVAQRAENAYVGVPCGIMDQSAATLCREGHALFLDCRSLASEQVPFGIADAGLATLVIDTRAPHRLVTGEYAQRRATCEAAAHSLGVAALRDVEDLDAALAALPDELSRRRVRHVVTENDRVRRSVELLRAGRPEATGPLLDASHASLRDDYEVTVPELDLAAEAAVAAGALGARMTGGGFGGCVIALVRESEADTVAGAVADAFAARGFIPPVAFVATPAAGVRRDQPADGVGRAG